MFKKILTTLLACFMVVAVKAEGIRFDKKLSWAAIKEKARKENKYIFMDCQTTWCGWCKKLEKEVFTDDKAGAFFNANFISISVQFDQKPAQDDDYVKSWYKDAGQIQKEHPMPGYPTLLIFAPDGRLVHRLVGYMPVEELIAAGKKSLHPEGQYYTQFKKYEAGERSPEFLKEFIPLAQAADFPEIAAKAFAAYYPIIKDPFTKDNLTLIASNTHSTQDAGFDLFSKNAAKVDAVLGKDAALNKRKKVIRNEIMEALGKNEQLDTDSLKAVYRTRYPDINMEKPIDDLRLDAALSSDLPNRKDLYLQLAKNYVSKYGSDISPDMWAVLSWNVSSSSTDEARLRLALDWCKKGMEKSDGKNTSLIDCYSRILYKLGEKQEAIKWAEKLVSLLPENDREQSQAMLEKMKKGV